LFAKRAQLFTSRLLFCHDFIQKKNRQPIVHAHQSVSSQGAFIDSQSIELFGAVTNVAILQWLLAVAGGVVTSFGVAGTQADRLFRLVDLA
jgi:hypothetical protein